MTGQKEQKALGETFFLGMESARLHKEMAMNEEAIARATIDNAVLEAIYDEE